MAVTHSADGRVDHDRVAAAVEEDAGVASCEEFAARVVVQRGVLDGQRAPLLSTTKKMPPPPSRALLLRMTVPSMSTL